MSIDWTKVGRELRDLHEAERAEARKRMAEMAVGTRDFLTAPIDDAGYVHFPKVVIVDDEDGSIGFDLTVPEDATDEEVAAAMGEALRKLIEKTRS